MHIHCILVKGNMATGGRSPKQPTKRSGKFLHSRKSARCRSDNSASGTPRQATTTSDNTLQAAEEWSNDHEFLSPNDIYTKAIGPLYFLIKKCLFNVSFTTFYRRK